MGFRNTAGLARARDASLGHILERRRAVRMVADSGAWVIGLALWALLRFDFAVSRIDWDALAVVAAMAVGAQLAIGQAVRLYRGRWRAASHSEIRVLAPIVVVIGILLFPIIEVLQMAYGVSLPRSAGVFGGLVALVLMAFARSQWRRIDEIRRRPSPNGRERLVVFGAGDAGTQIVTAMLRDPDSPFVPVALLDDSPTLRYRRIEGLPVVGTSADIERVAAETDAGGLLIAIPTAGSELIRSVTDTAERCGLQVRVLPRLAELVEGPLRVAHIREVTPADLLGRDEADIDLPAIAGYVRGRRVLVTGGGGSIGSELCRQIAQFDPEDLIILDRDESALHAVQLSIDGQGQLDSQALVVADIRDRTRIDEVFARWQPQVVFHAAALKHVPLLEMYPREALKTNVIGTLNVLEAAARNGVERFVNISTDKAADPRNVLGYTKRLAERLTAHVAAENRATFMSVRFGNVLGSRGSVLTAFDAQIKNGGPVTVTHPDVTRYFMTVEEAVRLVVQAGITGSDGEILVLDMGVPVRIDDVARRLIAMSGKQVDVVYTGLRPGEKLHEVLFAGDESGTPRDHPQIRHTAGMALHPAVIQGLTAINGEEELRAALADASTGRTDRTRHAPLPTPEPVQRNGGAPAPVGVPAIRYAS